MDLKTITTFQKIVEVGTFQRASQELNYAQSTITAQIKNLEDELGVSLLERGRTVTLTEAGKVFYEKSTLLLKGYDHLIDAMTEVIDQSRIIRIGVMEPFASYRLPKLLEAFKEQYPDISLAIQIESNRTLLQLVQDGTLDFAICAPSEVPPECLFTPMLQEDVVLLAHEAHPLAKEAYVQLAQLEPYKLLTTSPYCPFRQQFEHQAMTRNFYPQYEMEISNMMAVKNYILNARHMALVPAITAEQRLPHTVIIPMKQVDTALTIGLLEKQMKAQENEDVQQLKRFLSSI